MATITATSVDGAGVRALTETTLDGTNDTFSFSASRNMVLALRNPTASPITPTITGDGSTTVPVAGIGDVDVSSGYSPGAIAADTAVAIPLDTISAYIKGDIEITSGSGLVATLTVR